MVDENVKLATFQEIPEVVNCEVNFKKLLAESVVVSFSRLQLG